MATRVDALGESSEATIGIETRAVVEARLRQLEGRAVANGAGKGKGTPQPKPAGASPGVAVTPKSYNTDADAVVKTKKVRAKRVSKGAGRPPLGRVCDRLVPEGDFGGGEVPLLLLFWICICLNTPYQGK